MSVPAIKWVWKQRTVKGTVKFVLLALADFADVHGACCPTVADIATKTSFSERTVMRALQELEGKGLLVKVRRRSEAGRQASTVYQLLMGEHSDPRQHSELNQAVV